MNDIDRLIVVQLRIKQLTSKLIPKASTRLPKALEQEYKMLQKFVEIRPLRKTRKYLFTNYTMKWRNRNKAVKKPSASNICSKRRYSSLWIVGWKKLLIKKKTFSIQTLTNPASSLRQKSKKKLLFATKL